LLERYGSAVQRYLRALVRSSDSAEDLFQEFACRLIKGDLQGADPERGKFRSFVKGVLFHLVADHHNRQKRLPGALPEGVPGPAGSPPTLADFDRDFVQTWREELLARCWDALQESENSAGKPFYAVLRFRAEHPKMPSQEMAEALSRQLGKPLTAAGVRQTLHRARDKFAQLVLDEVLQSLDKPTPQQVEDELSELGLLEYCRPALEKKAGPEE